MTVAQEAQTLSVGSQEQGVVGRQGGEGPRQERAMLLGMTLVVAADAAAAVAGASDAGTASRG